MNIEPDLLFQAPGMRQALLKTTEASEPRRVGCILDGDSAKMLDAVLAAQHRSFTDWLKRSIELDYRDLSRQGTY